MRKLKKKEVMMVSRILKDIDFKSYVENLMSTKVEAVLKTNEFLDEKIAMIMGDIAAFVLQNMHEAEENIDLLIKSYKKISQDQLDDLEIDEYLDSLKVIFMAGIPKVLSKYVDLTEFKKKLNQLEKKN